MASLHGIGTVDSSLFKYLRLGNTKLLLKF